MLKNTFLNYFFLTTSPYRYFYLVVIISIQFLFVHCLFVFSYYSVALLFLLMLFFRMLFSLLCILHSPFMLHVFPFHFPLYYINFVYTAFSLSWSLLFKPFSLQLPFCCQFFAHLNYQSFHPTYPLAIHHSLSQSTRN